MAAALLAIAGENPPPRRFIAGADVIALAQRTSDRSARPRAARWG